MENSEQGDQLDHKKTFMNSKKRLNLCLIHRRASSFQLNQRVTFVHYWRISLLPKTSWVESSTVKKKKVHYKHIRRKRRCLPSTESGGSILKPGMRPKKYKFGDIWRVTSIMKG